MSIVGAVLGGLFLLLAVLSAAFACACAVALLRPSERARLGSASVTVGWIIAGVMVAWTVVLCYIGVVVIAGG